jgi:tripartite ATP-independent transporter DctP family solute receptor
MIGKWLVAAAVGLVAGAGHAAEVVLRWGDVVPATHPSAQMIDRVAAAVKDKTGGRIEIQGFPGGQLGGSRDMIEAVANGIQEMVTEGAANFGTWLPTISVVEAPYIWRDAAHLVAAMSGPIGKDYDEQLRKARGMRILGTTYYGTRHLTTSKKEVKSVADMVGFKLRVPENEVFKAMAEAWGARPTPINFNELYLALQQGVVDGQENPLPTIQSAKLFEVQKYLVLTGHIITARLVVINEAAYQRLKPEDRAALEAAVAEGIAWQNEEIRKAEASLVLTLEKAGMTVITPDVASFREAVLKVVPQRFEARWGKGTWERIQAVR